MITKCLVAETVQRAQLWAKAFDLDPKEWMLVGWNSSLAGYRFDKVIIVELPTNRALLGVHKDWYETVIYTRMTREGVIHNLI